MTKRSGTIENNLCKKPRLEQDDWDNSDLDDCLVLATQMCEQSVNNSILPTYGEFEKSSVSRNIYCSTQIQQKTSNNVNKEASEQVKILKEKCEAKEGEVTILRHQLQVIKTNLDVEFSKKKKELTDKINVSTQKINALKSDLEFRDFEIANLKQKIVEISKANRLDLSFSFTQIQHQEARQTGSSSQKETTTNSYFDPIYSTAPTGVPLHDTVNFRHFGYLGRETYFLKTTNNSLKLYLIPHINDDTSNDLTGFEVLNLDDKKLCFSKLSKEICIYLNSPEREFNLEKKLSVVTKILSLSFFFLESLNSFLEGVSTNIQTKDIRQIDNLYLENKLPCNFQKASLLDADPIFEDEIGISFRQCVALIALIIPFNKHIENHILENKHINTECLEETLKLNTDKCLETENYFLSQLLHVIMIIGKTRKTHLFSGLLLATVDLLTSISATNSFDKVNQLVVNITKEIVFSRPNLLILEKISSFLVKATVNLEFVNKLCRKPIEKTLKGPQKEGITYFNSGACILQIYCILIDTSLKNSDGTHLNLYSNIIKTLANILESNSSWTFYQENEHNDCLSAISRLFIDLTHNFLHTIKVELFPKSRYFPTVEMLESLQSSEDDCNVPSSNFNNISLWDEI
ncbi:uncharacterized protein LOC108741427 isoform X2 [Agrilus planipennis]|uniref:Uncharacterized protein LOC108741427 isoform X2 n=1 Tax=Agrilus planipennis TaxID=224129 RepID=A0A7F5RAA0_AGRPL|nr:uncharacterized protein LOC108741427 isoform X2 [Agrilus planipennis]